MFSWAGLVVRLGGAILVVLGVSDGDEGGRARFVVRPERGKSFSPGPRAGINLGVGGGRNWVGHLEKAVSAFAAGPTRETLRPGQGEILRDSNKRERENLTDDFDPFFSTQLAHRQPSPNADNPSRRPQWPRMAPLTLD